MFRPGCDLWGAVRAASDVLAHGFADVSTHANAHCVADAIALCTPHSDAVCAGAHRVALFLAHNSAHCSSDISCKCRSNCFSYNRTDDPFAQQPAEAADRNFQTDSRPILAANGESNNRPHLSAKFYCSYCTANSSALGLAVVRSSSSSSSSFDSHIAANDCSTFGPAHRLSFGGESHNVT